MERVSNKGEEGEVIFEDRDVIGDELFKEKIH